MPPPLLLLFMMMVMMMVMTDRCPCSPLLAARVTRGSDGAGSIEISRCGHLLLRPPVLAVKSPASLVGGAVPL